MKDTFTVIAFGDVVGPYATEKLGRAIKRIKSEYSADMVIVNAENSAKGNGVDISSADYLLRKGADILTSGNHVWKRSEIKDYLDGSEFLIRPANYPPSCPGKGFTYYDSCGIRVLVMNVLGTVYMDPLDSPFDAVSAILKSEKGNYDISVLDVHAEATSEKLAIANYFDGRITAVFGTHTHVRTADARLLPKGTAYITDIGMTGRPDSILGVDKEQIIEHMTTHMPTKFNVGDGETEANFAVITVDMNTKKAISIISASAGI
ncbi:MAG: TIGR00282 family metallophosphoesterase [Firmicutes bacterium]|nr:TIGR00282 family metallophosphoesterase [Candidatus Colimorpha enterica]